MKLSADIKINNPKFLFQYNFGGSSALGEAHMNKEFYTSNLTNLNRTYQQEILI